ncbi:hypothetical protein B0H14DRAFT_3576728, partial [Mycena olivaceomarginata]
MWRPTRRQRSNVQRAMISSTTLPPGRAHQHCIGNGTEKPRRHAQRQCSTVSYPSFQRSFLGCPRGPYWCGTSRSLPAKTRASRGRCGWQKHSPSTFTQTSSLFTSVITCRHSTLARVLSPSLLPTPSTTSYAAVAASLPFTVPPSTTSSPHSPSFVNSSRPLPPSSTS